MMGDTNWPEAQDLEERPVAAHIVKELELHINGQGLIQKGPWQRLMRTAVKHGHRDWQICDRLGTLGSRIITEHHANRLKRETIHV